MGKPFKILLSLFAFLAALILIAAIALPLIVDPNDFKPEIEAAVKKHTGRDVRIEGDLQLSVFPWLGLQTGKVSLSNAAGFGERPFAAVDKADVKIKLLPLLSKRLEVSRITLKGLDLNLITTAKGESNWSDLGKTGEDKAAARPTPADRQPGTPQKKPPMADREKTEPTLVSFAVAGISLMDSRVTWDDRRSGKRFDFKDLNVQTDDLAFGEPVDVDLSFVVTSQAPELSDTVTLSARLTVDETLQHFRLDDLKLDSSTRGAALQGGEVDADLRTAIVVDAEKGTVSGERLDLRTRSRGIAVEKARFDAALATAFSYDMARKRLRLTGFKVNAEGAGLPGGKLTAQAAADIWLDLARQTLKVDDLRLEAENFTVAGELTGERVVDDPKIAGPVTVSRFSPRELMKRLAVELPETADPKTLSNLEGKFQLAAGKTGAQFNGLALTLDDSKIAGRVSIDNFDSPAIAFDLTVDSLDADRYLPPEKSGTKAPAPKSQGIPAAGKTPKPPAADKQDNTELFPVETLRKLNLNGTLTINRLKAKGLKMAGVTVKVDADNGLIRTRQSIDHFYQGSYRGAVKLNVQGRHPQLAVNEHLSSVQAEPLLRDWRGKSKITGTADVDATLKGNGNSVDALKASLAGNVSARLTDGVVKGFNLQKIIDEAKNELRRLKGKETKPSTEESDETPYSRISMTARVARGRVRNDDLLAVSRSLHVNGKGEANLLSEEIDYKVIAKLIKSAATETEPEKIKGVPVAIKVRGNFSDPRFRLSLEDMLMEQQKAKIEEKKQELLEKLDEKLEKKLPGAGELLKKFF